MSVNEQGEMRLQAVRAVEELGELFTVYIVDDGESWCDAINM